MNRLLFDTIYIENNAWQMCFVISRQQIQINIVLWLVTGDWWLVATDFKSFFKLEDMTNTISLIKFYLQDLSINFQIKFMKYNFFFHKFHPW